MFAKTLKTTTLKTAMMTSFQLAIPAVRIGQGLRASTAYPTDHLSPGPLSAPQNPEPEQARVWQLSAEQMRKQMRMGNRAVPPASLAGCPSAPGFSAVMFASPTVVSQLGWQRVMQSSTSGGTSLFRLPVDPSRTNFPGALSRLNRFGRDCQSPNRDSDKQRTIRGVSSAATAKK
jgi:hypothetical protein